MGYGKTSNVQQQKELIRIAEKSMMEQIGTIEDGKLKKQILDEVDEIARGMSDVIKENLKAVKDPVGHNALCILGQIFSLAMMKFLVAIEESKGE